MSNSGKALADAVRKGFKAPPFDEDLYVKDWVSGAFRRDGTELFYRAKLTQNWSDQGHSKAFKLFVDLIMSAECSLKSLIISCSPSSEAPEAAYKVARSKGHILKKLGAEAISRENKLKSTIDLKLLEEADKVGVHSRYSIEVLRLLSTETTEERFFSEGPYSKVLNDDWLKKFAGLVQRLSASALDLAAEKLPCASHRYGDEIGKAQKRLNTFKQTVFAPVIEAPETGPN
jgi:hypothetical protein